MDTKSQDVVRSFDGACVQDESGQIIAVGEHCTIGRHGGSSVVVEGGSVSRWHAVILWVRGGEYWAIDLDTKNGTYVNGERLISNRSLSNGDIIQVGTTKLRFLGPEAKKKKKNSVKMTATETASGKTSREEDLYEPTGQAVVIINPKKDVVAMTATARSWLRIYFPGSQEKGLPLDVLDWVDLQLTRQRDYNMPTPPPDPLLCKRQDRRLSIRLAADAEGHNLFLMFEESSPLFTEKSLAVELKRTFGVSKRGCEVLYYVTQGKTSPEIALILELSERTVEAHLGRAFQKLSVHSRQEAVLLLFRHFKSLRRGGYSRDWASSSRGGSRSWS